MAVLVIAALVVLPLLVVLRMAIARARIRLAPPVQLLEGPASTTSQGAAVVELTSRPSPTVFVREPVPLDPAIMGSPVNITLRFLGGEEMKQQVFPGQRVHVLKSQVCGRLGIPLARAKLIHETGVLHGDREIEAYDLAEDAVVNVIVLPPLYEGSEAYESIAKGIEVGHPAAPDREEVDEQITQMMENKMALHNALVARGLLR